VPESEKGNGRPSYHLSQGVVNLVAMVVVLVWATGFVADILIEKYVPPSEVHLALMVVLGGVFGAQFLRKP
jgi:hypothetical protein